MSDQHHDLIHATHTHDGKPIQNDDRPPLEAETLETAVRELLIEKGVISAEEIRQAIELMDGRGPALGAKIVARAWVDAEFTPFSIKSSRTAVSSVSASSGGRSSFWIGLPSWVCVA